MPYGFSKTDTYPVKRGPFMESPFGMHQNKMKVEFLLGKCGYGRRNRRENAVTVEIRWDGADSFSVIGTIWNRKRNDCLSGGQNEEAINSIKADFCPESARLWDEIYQLWTKYHLVDMRPGTPRQMEYLDSLPKRELGDWYGWACVELKKAGLYEVPDPDHPGKTCEFGTRWFNWHIPEEARKRIQALFDWDCKID